MFSKYYFVTQHSNVKEFKKIIIQKTWLIDLLCTVYITNPVNIYKHANMLVNVMSTSDLFQIDFKIITSIISYDLIFIKVMKKKNCKRGRFYKCYKIKLCLSVFK